ncbi:hypothetical protein [Sphingomonas glaciei]|uniref:Glycosyltransferase RgtA/B/C/D-like domain-containing protein n=1 Tax=Sphingomonas glaciei TaxID=2938948 RepID=A0ABY5MWP3_9SPHN|nr:hypothetical protein [Sphingomonas glaciei]UUR08190.1 hypothetical protein M1K48_00645 [Sphingomonas glaciei]
MTSTSTPADPGVGSGWNSIRPEPLLAPRGTPPLWQRLVLLGAWVVLVGWLASLHVVWRDEARAYAFAIGGDTVVDMLRGLRGEGHPSLWYLILRAGHELTSAREVLSGAGLLFGFLAAALFALKAPFRLWVLFATLFSAFFVMDYTVIARNYGIAALLMFAIAAWWERIKDSLWFGLLLFLLANVNVPVLILAGALFLFRALEVLGTSPSERRGEWARLAVNAVLAASGALASFLTVYPPFNDAAVGLDKRPLTACNLVRAIFHQKTFVRDLGIPWPAQTISLVFITGSLLVFARHKRALIVAVLAFFALKFFFFFIYMAYLRHIALFLVFLLALAWIVAKEGGEKCLPASHWRSKAVPVGKWMLVLLLSVQVVTLLRKPVAQAVMGVPYSRSADLAALMERPDLRDALLIVDPDMVGEAVVYYRGGKPLWLLRQSRFGSWAPFSKNGRGNLTLDDILADARLLNGRTGRPVAIALQRPIGEDGDFQMMFQNRTAITPEGRSRFLAATRPLVSLRPAQTDEEYDVYLYTRGAAGRGR